MPRRAFSNAVPGNGIVLSADNGGLTGVIRSWQFSNTITEADPGAGYWRFNHADPESGAFIYVSATDGQANDMTGLLSAFGVGTKLQVRSANAPGQFLIITITSNDDNSAAGWSTLGYTVVSGEPNFIDDETLVVEVGFGGAQGPQGEGVPAGGTTGQVPAKASGTDYDIEWVDQSGGDVVGPADSADNEIMRFSGTTGKVAQRSGVYIDDNGRVGIGAGSPGYPLEIRDSVDALSNLAYLLNTNVGSSAASRLWFRTLGGGDPIFLMQTPVQSWSVAVDGSVSSIFRITNGSSPGSSAHITLTPSGGMQVGAPTGGDQGTGTINAVGVYTGGAELTDIVQDFIENGKFDDDDVARWDAIVPDIVIPEHEEEELLEEDVEETKLVPEIEEGRAVLRRKVEMTKRPVMEDFPVEDEDGQSVMVLDKEGQPVLDKRGKPKQHVLQRQKSVKRIVPAQTIVTTHKSARVFRLMVDAGLDPSDYKSVSDWWLNKRYVPGLVSADEWATRKGAVEVGEYQSRISMAQEILLAAFVNLAGKVDDHEARIEALEEVKRSVDNRT